MILFGEMNVYFFYYFNFYFRILIETPKKNGALLIKTPNGRTVFLRAYYGKPFKIVKERIQWLKDWDFNPPDETI